MNKTTIEWTHWSTNPLKMKLPNDDLVNVCIHKSEGCRHCYAEAIVRHFWKKEWGDFPGYTPALLKLGTPVLVEEELRAVLRLSDRITQGKADPEENKIFWNDMTDKALDFWPDELLDRIWAIRALTPNLIHQVLTKRIERMASYLNDEQSGCVDAIKVAAKELLGESVRSGDWPLSNVHLGVSVEDQTTADERIPLLLKAPAAVRWISYEPALAPVRFTDGWLLGGCQHCNWTGYVNTVPTPPGVVECSCVLSHLRDRSFSRLDWIVVGGESGPGARPFNVQWARDTIAQCKAAGVPCFVKQLGAHPCFKPEDEERQGNPMPSFHHSHGDLFCKKLKDKKGGDWDEWPPDLRVRQYPE